MARLVWVAGAAAILVTLGGSAPSAANEGEQVVRVERVPQPKPKQATLRFLEENRDFFRARLDRLKVTLGLNRGDSRALDPRLLRYAEMLATSEGGAATAREGAERIRKDELLASVDGLIELEAAMTAMETLLRDQRERLVWLEEDFAERQTTALVVLLTGVPSAGAPAQVLLQDPDGEDWRVSLSAQDREALANGGTIELLHRRVEPRAHDLRVHLAMDNGGSETENEPWVVALTPERNQITFLELQLETPLSAKVWSR